MKIKLEYDRGKKQVLVLSAKFAYPMTVEPWTKKILEYTHQSLLNMSSVNYYFISFFAYY